VPTLASSASAALGRCNACAAAIQWLILTPSRRGHPAPKKEQIVQIKISARHGHLHEATQEFIREKANKLTHYFQRLMMIEVIVDLHEDMNVVEFLVSAEHKHDFVAREQNKDILAAVDLVLDKLERQVRKYKEKIMDHRRTPSTGDVTAAPEQP
jgi:putative sigma-54 modulation protein